MRLRRRKRAESANPPPKKPRISQSRALNPAPAATPAPANAPAATPAPATAPAPAPPSHGGPSAQRLGAAAAASPGAEVVWEEVFTMEGMRGALLSHTHLAVFPRALGLEILGYARLSTEEVCAQRDEMLKALRSKWGLPFCMSMSWHDNPDESALRLCELVDRMLDEYVDQRTHIDASKMAKVEIVDPILSWQKMVIDSVQKKVMRAVWIKHLQKRFENFKAIIIHADRLWVTSYTRTLPVESCIAIHPSSVTEFVERLESLPSLYAKLAIEMEKQTELVRMRNELTKLLHVRYIGHDSAYGRQWEDRFAITWAHEKYREWLQKKEWLASQPLPDHGGVVTLRLVPDGEQDDTTGGLVDRYGMVRVKRDTTLEDVVACLIGQTERLRKDQRVRWAQQDRMEEKMDKLKNLDVCVSGQMLYWWRFSPDAQLWLDTCDKLLQLDLVKTFKFSSRISIMFEKCTSEVDSIAAYRLKNDILTIPTNFTPETLAQRLQAIAPFLLRTTSLPA